MNMLWVLSSDLRGAPTLGPRQNPAIRVRSKYFARAARAGTPLLTLSAMRAELYSPSLNSIEKRPGCEGLYDSRVAVISGIGLQTFFQGAAASCLYSSYGEYRDVAPRKNHAEVGERG